MPIGRAIAAFALLPFAFVLERFAYYSTRSMMIPFLMARSTGDLGAAEIGQKLAVLSMVQYGSFLLGGLIAFAIGPAITMTLGATLIAASFAVLASGPDQLGVFTVLLGVGEGLFRPCLLALAALFVPHPRQSLRVALFVGLYLLANVGGFGGGSVGGLFHGNFETLFILAAAIAGFSVLVCVAVTVIHFASKARAIEPTAMGKPALLALALSVLVAPYALAFPVAHQLQFDIAHRAGAAASEITIMFWINGVVIGLVSLAYLAVLVVLHFQKKRVPVSYPIGAGLLLFALGGLPLVFGDSLIAVYAAAVVLALGESLIFAFAVSRVAADSHPRVAALIVAAWLFLWSTPGHALQAALQAASDTTLSRIALGVCLLFAIGAAAILVIFGSRAFAALTPDGDGDRQREIAPPPLAQAQ